MSSSQEEKLKQFLVLLDRTVLDTPLLWNKKTVRNVINNKQDWLIMQEIFISTKKALNLREKETVIIPIRYISWTSTWFCRSHLWPFHGHQFASFLIDILLRSIGVEEGPCKAGSRWLLSLQSCPTAVTVELMWRSSSDVKTKTTVLRTRDLTWAKDLLLVAVLASVSSNVLGQVKWIF